MTLLVKIQSSLLMIVHIFAICLRLIASLAVIVYRKTLLTLFSPSGILSRMSSTLECLAAKNARFTVNKKETTDVADSRDLERHIVHANRHLKEKEEMVSQLLGEKLEIKAKGRCNVANRDNQPMELADGFQDLFDNEWRDAMKEIFKEEELAGIRFLAKILRECQIYSKDMVEKYASPCKPDVTDYHLKQILKPNDFEEWSKHRARIGQCPAVMETVSKSFLDKCKAENSYPFKDRCNGETAEKSFEAYLKRCCDLCWHSATLDPPLLLEFDVTGRYFDEIRNRFQKYIYLGDRDKTGPNKTVMDVVWPAVISVPPDGTEVRLVGNAKGAVITFEDTSV